MTKDEFPDSGQDIEILQIIARYFPGQEGDPFFQGAVEVNND